jgi:hypothetical protein
MFKFKLEDKIIPVNLSSLGGQGHSHQQYDPKAYSRERETSKNRYKSLYEQFGPGYPCGASQSQQTQMQTSQSQVYGQNRRMY